MNKNWIVIPVVDLPSAHDTIKSARHQARIQCQTHGIKQVIYEAVEVSEVPIRFLNLDSGEEVKES